MEKDLQVFRVPGGFTVHFNVGVYPLNDEDYEALRSDIQSEFEFMVHVDLCAAPSGILTVLINQTSGLHQGRVSQRVCSRIRACANRSDPIPSYL